MPETEPNRQLPVWFTGNSRVDLNRQVAENNMMTRMERVSNGQLNPYFANA